MDNNITSCSINTTVLFTITSKTRENTIHLFLIEIRVDQAVTNGFDLNPFHIKSKLMFNLDKFFRTLTTFILTLQDVCKYQYLEETQVVRSYIEFGTVM